ncbi:MAG: ATP synthase subunit I [Oscillospiraceae bacterium]|nr:ATP synthase subunit I [Oscillospiraceae bacterium]
MAERPEIPVNNPEEQFPAPDMSAIPKADKKETFRSVLPVMITEVILSAAMILVYVLVGRFSSKVLFGALLGTVAELANFSVMLLSLLKAEKAESVARGQLSARGNYLLRMVILLVILALALKTGRFDPLATLLPLCFMRLALFASQLFYKNKKGEDS